MSTRLLNRHFRERVGATPAQWIIRARIRRAQRLLEMTDLAIERIAAAAGFGSAAVMRHHFGDIVGTTPLAYRRAFRLGKGQRAAHLGRAAGLSRVLRVERLPFSD
jgi:transcriptional regulator GlxA family with amidase domain